MNEGQGAAGSHDRWVSGQAYEQYVGRWSRAVAGEFLAWLEMPAGSRWLDVGCGTGALAQTILQTAAPAGVLGIDSSQEFVEFAQRRLRDDRATFRVADAEALHVDPGAFDAVVSALAVNFLPRPDRAVAEMARAARPGGTVGAYVWDYAGKMQLLRYFWDAAAELELCGERPGRRQTLPPLPPRTSPRTLPGSRAHPHRHSRHRCPDGFQELRRLLVTVPRGAGARAGVRDVLERGGAIWLARAPESDLTLRLRRLDPPGGAGLGRARQRGRM